MAAGRLVSFENQNDEANFQNFAPQVVHPHVFCVRMNHLTEPMKEPSVRAKETVESSRVEVCHGLKY